LFFLFLLIGAKSESVEQIPSRNWMESSRKSRLTSRKQVVSHQKQRRDLLRLVRTGVRDSIASPSSPLSRGSDVTMIYPPNLVQRHPN